MIFLQDGGITAHTPKCAKSIELFKVVENILIVVSFDNKCVVLSIFLKRKQLKNHAVIIRADQKSTRIIFYYHKYLENTKKLYAKVGFFDDNFVK